MHPNRHRSSIYVTLPGTTDFHSLEYLCSCSRGKTVKVKHARMLDGWKKCAHTSELGFCGEITDVHTCTDRKIDVDRERRNLKLVRE